MVKERREGEGWWRPERRTEWPCARMRHRQFVVANDLMAKKLTYARDYGRAWY
jgi:hypothetical protein